MAASAEPGTESEAAALARAYFEAVARRDLDAMHAFYAPDGVGEIHGLVELRAHDTYRPWFAALFAAFPDFEFEILDVLSAGDKAAVRWRASSARCRRRARCPNER